MSGGCVGVIMTSQNKHQSTFLVTLSPGDKETVWAGGVSGSFVAAYADESQMDTPFQLLDLLEHGESYKRYGATVMNDRSSRTHTVLILNLTHVCLSPSKDTSIILEMEVGRW